MQNRLSRGLIVRTALRIVEAGGLDSLSMRALAAELKVQASSLYEYFPGKGALMGAMMEVLFDRCLVGIGQCETWQDWMCGFGRAIWQVQRETPPASLLIAATDLGDDHFDEARRKIVEQIEKYDGPVEFLLNVQSAVQALVTGWSVFAHSRFSSRLDREIQIDTLVSESISSLVRGWSAKYY